jgi:lysophospholipase L1-like esterase
MAGDVTRPAGYRNVVPSVDRDGEGGPGPAGFALDPGLFSADRFHPSSEGYAVIASALAPAVRAAAAAAHQMTG